MCPVPAPRPTAERPVAPGRLCLGVAVLAVAAACAVGCAGPDPVDVRDEAPAAVSLEPASPDLVGVLRATAALSSTSGALVNACLDQAGHPEATEAAARVRTVPDRYRPRVLGVVPLELGPTTYREARTLGFAGTPVAIEDDAHGFVISASEDFDTAADHCYDLVHDTFPDLAQVQTDAARFGDRVRRRMVDRLTAVLTPHLVERFVCVRRSGYPQLDPEAAVEEGSLDRILIEAGVTPGRPTTGWSEPTADDVPAGEVVVYDPAPARGYRPTAGEVEFARAYVKCGRRQHFATTLRASVKDVLSRLEVRYTGETAALASRLTQVSRAIRSTTTLGK